MLREKRKREEEGKEGLTDENEEGKEEVESCERKLLMKEPQKKDNGEWRWEKINYLNTINEIKPRFWASEIIQGGKWYLFGGLSSKDSLLDDIIVFNFGNLFFRIYSFLPANLTLQTLSQIFF